MNETAWKFFRNIFSELQALVEPLLEVLDQPRKLYQLFSRMGWNLEGLIGADMSHAATTLLEIRRDLAVLLDDTAPPLPEMELQQQIRGILDRLESLQPVFTEPTAPNLSEAVAREFSEDLLQYLLMTYLLGRHPVLFQIAVILTVIRLEEAKPLYAGGDEKGELLRFPVRRPVFQMHNLFNLSEDTFGQLLGDLGLPEQASFANMADALQKKFSDGVQGLISMLGPDQLDELAITLDVTGLGIRGSFLPFPEDVTEPITVSLWDDPALSLIAEKGAWKLSWVSPGTGPVGDLVLFRETGFEFALVGAGEEGCPESGLELARTGEQFQVRVAGGLKIKMPIDILTSETGDAITAMACGELTLPLREAPALKIDKAELSGRFQLGGANGLLVREARITVEDLAFPVAPGQPVNFRLSARGVLALPDSEARKQLIQIEAAFENGHFLLQSRGEIHLGSGIWLFPVNDQPVLAVQHQSDDSYEFAVSALFKVPHENGGTQGIQVMGLLGLGIDANGQWQVCVFQAAGQATSLNWTLPEGLILQGAGVSLRYSQSENTFGATLNGKLTLAANPGTVDMQVALLFNDLNDPTDITIDVQLAVQQLDLFDQARVVSATLMLNVTTQPLAGRLELRSGTAGLFPKKDSPSGMEDFVLGVIGLSGRFTFDLEGFELRFHAGQLQLPEQFGPDPESPTSPRPIVSLSETIPLTLSYRRGAPLGFQGQFHFSDLGVTLPGADSHAGLMIKLITATLTLTDHRLPELTGVNGLVRLPLPKNKTADILFEDFAWALINMPTGVIRLKNDIPLPLGGGFELTIRGNESQTSVATGLTITKQDGRPQFLIDGAVRLTIPADMLSGESGDQLFTDVAGNLLVTLDQLPRFTLEELGLGGTFRMGGPNGIKIKNARMHAAGIENVFDQSPDHPFELLLSGTLGLPDDGPRLTLKGARFLFVGEPLPRFQIEGMTVEPGAVLEAVEALPVQLTKAGFEFLDKQRPLPRLLRPDNLQIILGAALTLPIPPDAAITGRIDDLLVRFNPNGLPEVRVSGIGMGVENIGIGDSMTLTGMVYLGGLDDPEGKLFFAGKLGGKFNGAGIEALAAFGVKGPLGVCLDLSAGPAGIPLGPSGFLLTGAAGGVSFVNRNTDPCDFTTYVQLGDDGRPLENPAPLPAPAEPSATGDQAVMTTPAPLPEATEPLAFPCPAKDCPPPAMNILCQPHPDARRYPDRPIIKFSALEEPFLNQIGITRDFVESLGFSDPPTMAGHVAGSIRQAIEALWPPVPPHLSALNSQVEHQLDNLQASFQRSLEKAIVTALNGSASVYDTILEAAYAGVPCPDITYKLTGTFSYTGVSTFLSVTGGFILSSTGTAGLLGSVNIFGIPVGKAQGYLTATDPEGNPDISICGDILLAIGPLEFGQMRFLYECQGCVTGFMSTVANFARHLAGPFIAEVVERVAKEVKSNPDFDPDRPETALALLTPEQSLAFIAQLLNMPPDQVRPDVMACLRDLINDTWDSFQPEILLCGKVAPKLIGIPLMGELVSVSAFATKTDLAAGFSFSPSYLILNLLWYAGTLGVGPSIFPGVDKASIGFAVKFPDPIELLDRGFTGQFHSPEALAAYLEEGFAYVLANATYTIDYELAPFGMKMADSEARILMPRLTDHPAHPNSTWQRPEDRGQNLPSRIEIATAALAQNHLGNPLWRGTAAELAALSFADGKSTRDLSLNDYFPHGGILGAGKLAFPRALLDAPPLELLNRMFNPNTDIATRVTLAGQFVDEYILQIEEVGALAFYLPALNPPIFTVDGRDPTPQELMKSIQKLDLGIGDMATSAYYSFEESFLRGHLDARLLGIPLGYGEVVGVPPEGDNEGCFEVRAGIPPDSWLRKFVDEASLVFQIRQTPPQPVEERFREIARAIQSGSDPGAILAQLQSSLIHELPKVSLVAHLDNFRVPAELAVLLQVEGHVSAGLHAYSLLYDPDYPGDGPLARVRRRGGIAIQCHLHFGGPLGLEIDVPGAELSVFPGKSGLPGLSGDFTVAELGLPGGLPRVRNARLQFNSEPQPGETQLAFNSGQFTAPWQGSHVDFQVKGRHNAAILSGRLQSRLKLNAHIGPIVEPVSRIKVADRLTISSIFGGEIAVEARPTGLRATVSGVFDWNGRPWQVPAFTISVPLRGAADFVTQLIDYLNAQAYGIFRELFQDVSRFLDALKSGAFQLAAGVARVLKNVFKLSARAAAEALRSLGQGWREISAAMKDVYQLSYQTAVTVLTEAGFALKEIVQALKGVFQTGLDSAVLALRKAGYKATQVAEAIKGVYTNALNTAVAALKYAGYSAREVAAAVKGVFSNALNSVARALKLAGYNASQVAEAIKGIFTNALNTAVAALKYAGYSAREVAAAVKGVFSNVLNSVARALKLAGYNASQVADGIKSIFTTSTNAAAAALKYAGFTVAQVAGGLKGVFTNSTNTVGKALKEAGYSASQVASGIKNTFTTSTNAAAAALKYAGFTVTQVAGGLKSTFTNSTTTAAKALKQAGYSADDVGQGIKSAFTTSLTTAASAMKAAGFSADATLKMLTTVFGVAWGTAVGTINSVFGIKF